MIKGILALFTSGILTNPMVLLGMIVGSVMYASLDGSEIFQMYKRAYFYGIAFLCSVIYVVGFRRTYKENGDTDWTETSLSVIGGVFKFVLASLLMMSFISLFDMGDMKKVTGSDI